ncbi:hypothetical protein Tco_1530819 [Tanacetum coccineum]
MSNYAIREDGIKVVIFEDEIVKEGSKKWELTMCGYFVGNEEGIRSVIKNGPWMVNGKPIKGFVTNEIELLNEDNDVYEEMSGSASKKAQNELHCNYANVLNGLGGRDKDEFIQLISEKWNIDVNGFDMLKKNLNEAQIEIDKNPNNIQLREHEVPLLKEYTLALEDEENLLFQKAEFLGGQKDKECLDLDVNMFINKINSQDAIKMIEEVTNDEVKNAKFDTDDNKNPGPDGFTTKFYKKSWPINGDDVCNAVKKFFVKGPLDAAM